MSSARPATKARPIHRPAESDGPRQTAGGWFDCWPNRAARIRAHRCPGHGGRRCGFAAAALSEMSAPHTMGLWWRRSLSLSNATTRSATHRLTTNWQLHWTGPPRTGFGLPGATAGLNSIESLMLNRAPGSGLVVWRRALASSAGRLPYNARCREFARSASGSTPSRCDDLPRATHCRVAETNGDPISNQYGLSLARSSEALPASLWGRFPATNGSQAGLCRQH
jgi:hypothetical protein